MALASSRKLTATLGFARIRERRAPERKRIHGSGMAAQPCRRKVCAGRPKRILGRKRHYYTVGRYTVGRASQVEGSPRRDARATQRPTGPGGTSLSASRSLNSIPSTAR